MELITREEKSLLLFFETQAVDYGGTLEGVHMNAEDFAIAKRWNEEGFVHFGRIAFHDIARRTGVGGGQPQGHWCVLSEEAWKLAHAERRARCERVMATLKVERKGLPAQAALSKDYFEAVKKRFEDQTAQLAIFGA